MHVETATRCQVCQAVRLPVAAAAAPVAAATTAPVATATPVATGDIAAAAVIPRGAAAGIVVGADDGVATLVWHSGRVGHVAGVGRAVLTVAAAAELVVEPVAGERSAQAAQNARKETAASPP